MCHSFSWVQYWGGPPLHPTQLQSFFTADCVVVYSWIRKPYTTQPWVSVCLFCMPDLSLNALKSQRNTHPPHRPFVVLDPLNKQVMHQPFAAREGQERETNKKRVRKLKKNPFSHLRARIRRDMSLKTGAFSLP